ncbi:MAG TPA: hypothetical protein VGK58_11195 [Lacipirellulaceae bacterium]
MVRRTAFYPLLVSVIAAIGSYRVVGAESSVPPQQQPQPLRDGSGNQTADRALLEQKIAERDRLQREIDKLRQETRTPQQILVNIRALEINRSKLRRVGVDWATADGGQRSITSIVDLMNPKTADRLETSAFGIVAPDEPFFGFVSALEENNIAKVLAEPSIVIVSGRPASFHVGGEFPMPAGPKSDKVVEFVNFGTQVDMLATSLGNDEVRLELRVRLSEPDYSRPITIEGQSVPSFHVRQCDTAFELPFGQSAVFTGLVQRREVVVRRNDGQRRDTEEIETLFIATPEFVDSLEVAKAYDPPAAIK